MVCVDYKQDANFNQVFPVFVNFSDVVSNAVHFKRIGLHIKHRAPSKRTQSEILLGNWITRVSSECVLKPD